MPKFPSIGLTADMDYLIRYKTKQTKYNKQFTQHSYGRSDNIFAHIRYEFTNCTHKVVYKNGSEFSHANVCTKVTLVKWLDMVEK